LHIGNPRAGLKVAAILSVVKSCRRLKISVRDHLAEVLSGLADVRIQRLPALAPPGWALTYNDTASSTHFIAGA
jgi:transposase